MGSLFDAQPQDRPTGARRTSTATGGDMSSPVAVRHVILHELEPGREPAYHELRCGSCGCHFTAMNIFNRRNIGCPLCGIRAKVIFNTSEDA